MACKFVPVAKEHRKHPGINIVELVEKFKPRRKTRLSVGYDIPLLESFTLAPGEKRVSLCDFKILLEANQVAILNARSSLHKMGSSKMKHVGVSLANTQGWIDADFAGNPENDGNIGVLLYNGGDVTVHFKAGDRVAQIGIFNFIVADDDADDQKEIRAGGVGSTGVQ